MSYSVDKYRYAENFQKNNYHFSAQRTELSAKQITQKITSAATAQSILDLWFQRLPNFNEVHYAVACSYLGKKKFTEADRADFQEMIGKIGSFLPRMSVKNIVNSANGLSKCSVEKTLAFQAISEEIQDRVRRGDAHQFQVVDVSLLLSAFAKCDPRNTPLFTTLASLISRFPHSVRAEESNLGQIASSLAEIQYEGPEFSSFLQTRMTAKMLSQIEERTLATLAHGLKGKNVLIENEVLNRYRKNRLAKCNFLDIFFLVHGLLKQENPNREIAQALGEVLEMRYKDRNDRLKDFNIKSLEAISAGFISAGFEREKYQVLSLISELLAKRERREDLMKAEARNLANLANNLAKQDEQMNQPMNPVSRAFFTQLREVLLERQEQNTLTDFNPLNIALLAKGFCNAGCMDESVAKLIATLCFTLIEKRGLSDFDADSLSMIIYALCERKDEEEVFRLLAILDEEIVRRLLKDRGSFALTHLSVIADNFARYGAGSDAFFSELEKILKQFYLQVDSRNISIRNFAFFINSFSRRRFGSKELYDIFENKIIEFKDKNELSDLRLLDLVECLNAFELSPHPSTTVFSIIRDELLRRRSERALDGLNKRHIQLLRVADHHLQDREFFHLVRESVVDALKANTVEYVDLFYYAQVLDVLVIKEGNKDEEVLDLLGKRIREALSSKKYGSDIASAFDLSIHAYSLSEKEGYRMLKLFEYELLVLYDKNQLQDFSVEQLARIARSYAKAKVNAHKLFDAIENVLLKRDKKNALGSYTSRELSLLLLSFTDRSNSYGSKEFYELLERLVLREDLSQFAAQAISTILLSFARLGYGSSFLFETLENEIETRFRKDQLQDFQAITLNQCIYGLTVADRFKTKAFSCLVETVQNRADSSTLKADPRDYLQLAFVDQFIALKEKKKEFFTGKLQEKLQSFDAKKIQKEDISENTTKQNEFFQTLQKVRPDLTYENNYEQFAGILSVDVLIEKEKHVIEYQGPGHYKYGTTNFIGTTLFKLEYLRLLGYRVTTVDYREFQDLKEKQAMEFAKEILVKK